MKTEWSGKKTLIVNDFSKHSHSFIALCIFFFSSSFFDEPTYDAAWARADVFDEVLVSPKMLTDHMPDIVSKALEQLADRNYAPRHVVNIRKSQHNVIV